MFSSLLTFAIASLTLVQAAVVPNIARAVPVGGAVVNIVPTIECTPLSGASGSLVMTSKDGLSVPLKLVDNVLQEDNVADGERQAFVFENCTSTFMAETPSETTYFGHISLASNSTECLTSYPGRDLPQHVQTEACSISDDSGQMLQFWQLTLGTSDTAAQVDFVGQSTKLHTGKFYVTDFSGADGSRVAQSASTFSPLCSKCSIHSQSTASTM
ncbi:hypothetical protein M408DRAFT_328562 [Serendipita vermifera MAFF 305830]|uniref:Ricin B lectin domain-containing protein n=1 Tax=Serendipita vermifera MAFF 305830 TaxID=933852 RepID=A0A0C2XL12_SERVB|nr:hypothetical protein M408DRAFT_328562 [Serendipita vermifera MAFF 305830]